ncbi:hypothetical protein FGD77_14225 [Roseovarius sp. M141]|nr:hypothetical protein [Roseovarius sp. M141]
MKAIAEYFRDLSASERGIDVEPANPDAKKLARIAEREISRHVEGQETDGKIHLRTSLAALPAMAPRGQDTRCQTSSDQPAPTLGTAPATGTGSDSIADKLRRIHAVFDPAGSDFPGSNYDEDELVQDLLVDTPQSPLMMPEKTETNTKNADQADESQTQLTKDGPGATEPRPLAARVIKMKRTYLEAAFASLDLEEVVSVDKSNGALSPEAEADLQRELAEVEAELDDFRASMAQTPPPETEEACAIEKMLAKDTIATDAGIFLGEDARRGRHREQPAPDAQASRIFDEANTQLDGPEMDKRRSDIQHLRAAVAATNAEHRAGGAMSPGVDDQPYRKDLQSAVRPRRPQPVTPTTPRTGAVPSGQSAPLRLVDEQRIDTPARPSPATPHATDHTDHAFGFVSYAKRMGAHNLTDLLEAAAAYMADIEGTPQFSRPMLVQKLREAHQEGFSREEGLRAFGHLLRQGKLKKLSGGRFAVTDVTDFRQSA